MQPRLRGQMLEKSPSAPISERRADCCEDNMSTRHFLLTDDGAIEEFSEEEASAVAEGKQDLPRYADQQLRYVQVAFDDQTNENGEIQVKTIGAIVSFDDAGHLTEAGRAHNAQDELNEFEHDACVQFALRDTLPNSYATH
ncbi:MAG: hypothetical protein CMP08_05150 [Xanthomonadales bacterium]|nr:hypothetical protein [Xanthomonadales bacterium]